MTRRLATLSIAAAFLRRGGLARPAFVATCTALVTALLLVALSVLLYGAATGGVFNGQNRAGRDSISGLVADPGVRGGYLFALLLICLAPLLLLRQVLRFGAAAREQRLASLRLAGATTSDVRGIAAVEVALPALVGGLGGCLLYLLLRVVAGGGDPQRAGEGSAIARELRLVPTSVSPSWWQVMLVLLAVGALGALAGATATRNLVISPLGVSRHSPGPPPRPWGLVAILLSVLILLVAFSLGEPLLYFTPFVVIALVVGGTVSLAPWIAYLAGRAAAKRARSVTVLLAARRLSVDARPAGRAGAAVGVVTLAAGVLGGLLADLLNLGGRYGDQPAQVDAFYIVPVALIGIVLVAALGLVVLSMTLHSVETVTDHRRSLAGLAALGVGPDDLERAVRWEVGLVALPVGTLGALLGIGPWNLLGGGGLYASIPLAVVLLTLALILGAVLLTARLARPWILAAVDPGALRTT